MISRDRKKSTFQAKQFLQENTPTLLQKINEFNSPKRSVFHKPFKSLSEHHKAPSIPALPPKSPTKPDNPPQNASTQRSRLMAESPRFDQSASKEPSLADPKTSESGVSALRVNRQLRKGLGMSHFHSSSTMQKSVPSVSFSRAERFALCEPIKISTSPNQHQLIVLPSTRTTKSTSFGFGGRVLIPTHLHKKDLINPAPNKYEVAENLNKPFKGKSFGVSFQAYSKVYMKHSKLPEIEMPGPGQYFSEGKKWRTRLARDLWGRKGCDRVLQTREGEAVSPSYYSPKTTIVESGRYKNIAFGTEKRMF